MIWEIKIHLSFQNKTIYNDYLILYSVKSLKDEFFKDSWVTVMLCWLLRLEFDSLFYVLQTSTSQTLLHPQPEPIWPRTEISSSKRNWHFFLSPYFEETKIVCYWAEGVRIDFDQFVYNGETKLKKERKDEKVAIELHNQHTWRKIMVH